MAVHGNRHPGKASSEGLEIARGARKSGRRPHGSGSSLLLGALLPTLLLAGVSPPAWAGSRDLLSGARNVSDSLLDSMRGGFSFGDMNFNFSFRSVTWINNTFQAETDLTLANNVVTVLKTVTAKPVLPNVSVGTLPGTMPESLNPAASTGETTPPASTLRLSMSVPESTGASGTESPKSPVVPAIPPSSQGSGPAKNTGALNPASTLIQVGTGNSGVLGNAFSNSAGLNTVIQNNANDVIIQHLTQINGVISRMRSVTHTTNMILRTTQSATLGSILSRF